MGSLRRDLPCRYFIHGLCVRAINLVSIVSYSSTGYKDMSTWVKIWMLHLRFAKRLAVPGHVCRRDLGLAALELQDLSRSSRVSQ